MIILTLNNLKNLNVSLQVGDAIYARSTARSVGADGNVFGVPRAGTGAGDTGVNHFVGILRKIVSLPGDTVELHTDLLTPNIPNPSENYVPYTPGSDDFIMFSKFDQIDGDVNGYYAQVKLVNNSKEKAEIFSIGSEVTINSI